ncbi:DUF637 domain-containing protein [Halomonas sp. A29]|uniref:DUF637 domain-containing protein n=1 Tax=Halomonas sp. A29 TaxID=3102786 RepID=UPI00398AAE97
MTNTTTNSVSGLDLGSLSDIGRFAGHRITHGIANAGLQTAINGGSFERNLDAALQGAVHHVVSAVLFNAVGDFSHGRYAEGSPEKIALHALAGGLAAEAMGGDFKTGAMAAGANEALVEYLDSQLGSQLGSDPETRTLFLTTASQLVGIVAAELVNGDVYQGAEIAAQATRYNYLRHDQVDAYVDELEGCEARGDCTEIQEKYRALSIAQQDELIALCATDSAACASEYQHLVDNSELFREALDGFGGREVPWRIGLDAGPLLGQYMEAESVVSQEGFAQFLKEQHGLDLEQASVLSAMAAGAVGLGATTSISSKALRAQLAAQEISRGHGFEKHVIQQGEFGGLGIRTRQQYANHIEDVLHNPSSVRYTVDGRVFYLQESTGTVVVRDPRAPDGGTAFQPENWYSYVSQLPSRTEPY